MGFRVNPDKGRVYLPGRGLVRPGDILVGEQYERFVKAGLLLEVPDVKGPIVEAPPPARKVLEADTDDRVPLESQEKDDPKKLLTEGSQDKHQHRVRMTGRRRR